jgi:hypothetical protein
MRLSSMEYVQCDSEINFFIGMYRVFRAQAD